jgi:carbon storage regulator
MLVLSRKNRESVVVGGSTGFEGLLKVTVLEISGGKVKLGFEAAADVPIHRFEVWERIGAGGQPARTSGPPVPTEGVERWEDDGGNGNQSETIFTGE